MKIDEVKKLHLKKYRAEFGCFLVEGEHLVLELQKAALHHVHLQRSELYVTGAYEHWQSPFRTHLISERQMAQIADTKTPQGIVARVPMPTTAAPVSASGDERAIYLHEIQDPGNLGTILRTLAWFGNFRCLLSPGSVDPYNPKVVRASMGAIFHAPLELDVGLDALRARFERIACLDMQGEPVQSADFGNFDCYLFGNEARGVPRERLTDLDAQPFTIHGCGTIESLNLAATVNMCAYELSRSRIRGA
ncbi:RNA methyltransferase [Stutzerimonas urumqiensis]|uniref:TrmH family RNA methyltransferase n=1 Tax=Stutzerimonas urumqiensis TaxID=638269 RepID=UPI003BACF961